MSHTLYSVGKSIRSKDGVEIYYEIIRNHYHKKFLVFIHGMGGDLTAWNEERRQLHELGYSSIAIDMRGHGLSGRPENLEAYDMQRFIEDITEVLKKEQIDKPILIGHCFGGIVSMAVAAKYPHLLKALVLIDTSYKPPHYAKFIGKHVVLDYFLNLFLLHSPLKYIHTRPDHRRFVNTQDYDIKRLISDVSHASLRTYLAVCHLIAHFDGTKLLKHIKVPTLVIEGVEDTIFSPDVAEELHQRIIKSEIQFIPHANHILTISNPREVVTCIASFLRRNNF